MNENEMMNDLLGYAQVVAILAGAAKSMSEAGLGTTKVMVEIESALDSMKELHEVTEEASV